MHGKTTIKGKIRFKHKLTSHIHPKGNVIYSVVNAILLLVTINNRQDAISFFLVFLLAPPHAALISFGDDIGRSISSRRFSSDFVLCFVDRQKCKMWGQNENGECHKDWLEGESGIEKDIEGV